DFHVTGVQTCALPIFGVDLVRARAPVEEELRCVEVLGGGEEVELGPQLVTAADAALARDDRPQPRRVACPARSQLESDQLLEREIGRASSRERAWDNE